MKFLPTISSLVLLALVVGLLLLVVDAKMENRKLKRESGSDKASLERTKEELLLSIEDRDRLEHKLKVRDSVWSAEVMRKDAQIHKANLRNDRQLKRYEKSFTDAPPGWSHPDMDSILQSIITQARIRASRRH